MKCFALVITTAALASAAAATAATPANPQHQDTSKPLEALAGITPPAGVTFVGTAERIAEPVDKQHEQWLGAGLWGGFGPYRYPFSCGGVGGFAYPLGYWNLYGARLYGGGCGFGFPYSGLYYC